MEEERIEDSFNFEKPISISIWTRNFWSIEEVGIVIMDLPIAKLNISSRYLESLGIYGSDNSNWSNGEDLLARHVRSCTSKSC